MKDIRQLSQQELEAEISLLGEKSFRSKQIYEWIWQKSAHSFNQMTNLSKDLREKLQQNYIFNPIEVEHSQYSNDGTIKNRFQLHDKHFVEGVLIPTPHRTTACVSSQVGCSLTCKFCATGQMKRERNLDPAEIYDQVVHINQQSETHFGHRLSNIVFMGMGEPLLNYANVMSSIDKICSPSGLNMSPQRITVSTAGVAKMIQKLADDRVRFNLALSLHAANDAKRNQIMPINETNNLEVLKEALQYFYEKTGTRITFEYIVFHAFNDELRDAQELANFARCVPCKINIIEYNTVEGTGLKNASREKVDAFANYLQSKNLIVNVRRSRGKDIDAACGQLANKNHSDKTQNKNTPQNDALIDDDGMD